MEGFVSEPAGTVNGDPRPAGGAKEAPPPARRAFAATRLSAKGVGLALALAAAAGAIGALLVHRYETLKAEFTEAALARRASAGALAATALADKLQLLTDLAVSLATRVRFQELVRAGRWEEAVAILRRVPEDFPFVDRVVLADTTGTVMAAEPAFAAIVGQNFAQRDWYRGVSREWKPYVSVLYRRAIEPRRNVLAVAVPIRDEGALVAGILVMQVKPENIFAWARSGGGDPHSRLLIVDREARVAFDSARELSPEAEAPQAGALVRAILAAAPGSRLAQVAFEGEEVVAGYTATAYGWGVIAVQAAKTTFAARDALLRQLLLDGAAILLLSGAAIALGALLAARRRRAAEEQRFRAALERQVAERTAELAAANRELEAFSYSVSHDLRSPLRAVDGYARMLEEDYAARLDEEGRRLLGVVRAEAARMGRLIDDLLAFSRVGRQPLRAAPVDMAALAREVVAELSPRYPAAAIEVAALPAAVGDRALLRQVWLNLLDNALKYSARRPDPRIEIGGRVAGEEIEYWVRDNGAGFDPRYAAKLFGVFQRLHSEEEFPGTGVGLAIVQRVVLRHGGRVRGEGTPGEGACFTFALAAREAAA
jgi:signal transduction histidine kinase